MYLWFLNFPWPFKNAVIQELRLFLKQFFAAIFNLLFKMI